MGGSHQDGEDLLPGTPVGPYDLIAPIGEGGMARVWVARVRGRGDLVAIKVLLPELAENEEFRKMFFDEANIASRIRHPNVCVTYELGQHESTLYIAMEWIDGSSLMRVLRPGSREDLTEVPRRPIRPRIAARIVADACAGLHAAHELRDDSGRLRDVVHRDVSPHNLLITQAGVVKVTDFGVAKAVGKSHMTIAGQLKGKLAYMAPEQLVGGTVDRRCDVFALGCVLYELTVGQRPFLGEHDPQVMASIMMGRMDPPRKLVPSYPPELEAIVLRALANETEKRFASAEEMRIALEQYLRSSGPPVTTTQIAELVRARCGDEIEQRTQSLTPPRAGSNPELPAPRNARPFESGSGTMAVDGGSRGGRGMVWLAVAAIVGASLGVGVLTYVKSTRKARAATAAAAAAASAERASAAASSLASTTAATAPVTQASGATGAASAGGAPSAGVATSTASLDPTIRRVHLRITPPTAVIVVNDVVMPVGTDTVARPPDGTSMNVLVRAEKHQDTVVIVDAATPDEVDVVLEPMARTPRRIVSVDGGGDGVASGSGQAKRAAKDAGEPALDTPPNPYE